MLPMAALAAWIMPSGRQKTHWPAAKALLISFFEWFGELGIFFGRMVRAAVVPPFAGRGLIRQMAAAVPTSLPLWALGGSPTGVGLSLSTHLSWIRCVAKFM